MRKAGTGGSGRGGGSGGGGGGGLKFGLIGPASKLKNKPGGGTRPIGAKPAPRRRPSGATAVFSTGDSDDDDRDADGNGDGKGKGRGGDTINGVAAVNKRLAAISAKQEKAAKKEYEEALAVDPCVFDYDRAYDGMQASRESKAVEAKTAHEKEKRKPKYIGNLLKQAKLREVESDRIFERKLQKEREAQDKLEGEATMKFVTSAYKKKLMEQKKWELQQQLEEKREQREDVTKKGMSGFYSNLITKNIAMGGDVETSAHSAFTTGSKRHAITDKYEMHDGNAKKAESSGSSRDGHARVQEEEANVSAHDSDTGDADIDANAPSARMVDPRAAAGAGARVNSQAPATESESEEQRARRSASLEHGAAAGSVALAGAEGGVIDEGVGVGTVRRREEGSLKVGMGDRGVLISEGDASERNGKRPRSEGMGTGQETERAGDDGGEPLRGEGAVAEDEGTAVTEEERKAAEESERLERAAAAKAKKEAAVKAARERFLARKKI